MPRARSSSNDTFPEDLLRRTDPANFFEEAPGISVFARGGEGAIDHKYSSYTRGLGFLIGTYNLLDVVPKGRDEDALPYGMAWVRHHDRCDL